MVVVLQATDTDLSSHCQSSVLFCFALTENYDLHETPVVCVDIFKCCQTSVEPSGSKHEIT